MIGEFAKEMCRVTFRGDLRFSALHCEREGEREREREREKVCERQREALWAC